MYVFKTVILLFLTNISYAETTGNLLNQTYFNGSTPINGWSGTNDHSHGGSIIAGVHGEYLENTITLGDTLNQSQMNGGWTSTFGSDIWHWNDYQSTVRMTQTITGADGTVTTQVRDVVSSPCGGNNCGSYVTYTDSYTQGINNQSNFDIKVRYDFSDTSQSSSHWSPDIKNPTLIIEHSLLSVEQQSTILEINETIDETIQQQVETIEFIPIEEFTFEVYEEPVVQMFEEIYIEEIAKEEINIGTVNVFNEIPVEVTYEEPKTIETFATEVESFEETTETTEITGGKPNEQNQPIERNSNIEEKTIVASNSEEKSGGTERVSEEENFSTTETEPSNETEANPPAERENTRSEERVESESETSTDTDVVSRDESNAEVSEVAERTVQLDVEDITRKVEQTVNNLDQQLVMTQTLIAKVMNNNDILKGYNSVNQQLFDNQVDIYGGNVDEYIRRNYSDTRRIYNENKITNNNLVFQYETKVQEAVDQKIRAEEHLRRIRGY